jgi:hypothetical protein
MQALKFCAQPPNARGLQNRMETSTVWVGNRRVCWRHLQNLSPEIFRVALKFGFGGLVFRAIAGDARRTQLMRHTSFILFFIIVVDFFYLCFIILFIQNISSNM